MTKIQMLINKRKEGNGSKFKIGLTIQTLVDAIFFVFNEFLPPIRNGSQLDNKIKMINNKKRGGGKQK